VSDVLYRRQPPLWPVWVWLVPTVIAVAVLAATGDGDAAWGVAMASGVIGLCAVLPFVISRRRYSTVTVTPEELRVGRDSFAIADLDPELLERQLTEALSWRAGKIAGGAWGPTLYERHLLIRVRGRPEPLLVPAGDPRALSRVLLDAR
jgi:hypothetical protein